MLVMLKPKGFRDAGDAAAKAPRFAAPAPKRAPFDRCVA